MNTETQALDLDRRSINVIRALAMDAVQKANSGHPGTPMALAPLADVFWTRIMKYDAAAPRLARPRSLRALGRPRVDAALLDALPHRLRPRARRHPRVPPVGLAHAGPPGVRPHQRRRDHHRPARSGLRQRGRHRDHREAHCARASAPTCATTTSSASAATATSWRASATKLRRSPATCSSAGSSSSTTTTTSRSTAAPSSRTATTCRSASRPTAGTSCSSARSPNDLDALEAGLRAGIAEETTADADRAPLAHRLPVAEGAGHRGRARQPARRRRGRQGQGDPRSARRRTSTFPTTCCGCYREAGAAARPRARPGEPHGSPRTQKPDEYEACLSGGRLHGWEQKLPDVAARRAVAATRDAIEEVLTAVVDVVPGLFTASGDLTGNTGMQVEEPRHVHARATRPGASIHFGIREHGMGAAANGMAASGLVPCVGTFFVFSDYMRPTVRLASIMQTKVCFVWTHDSVGVGEDGPTHQPVEQLASLRAMPGLRVIRPGRRQRGRGGVEGAPRRRRPDRAAPHPPEGPGARRHGRARAGRRARGRVRARAREPVIGPTSCSSAPAPRCQVCVAAARAARAARHRGARRVDAVVVPVRAAARRVPRRRAAARRARRSRSRPACGSAGSATPTTS